MQTMQLGVIKKDLSDTIMRFNHLLFREKWGGKGHRVVGWRGEGVKRTGTFRNHAILSAFTAPRYKGRIGDTLIKYVS
jgi:hypothetical protein